MESDKSKIALLSFVIAILGLIGEIVCSPPPVFPILTIVGGSNFASIRVSANWMTFSLTLYA